MTWKKLRILFILVVLSSFVQAKDECPEKCTCSEDFSVVKCRGMEKFPVFGFASKVKTLDLTRGKIKTIHEKEVKAYKNLENLFISHNPLDCDHATIHTLRFALTEITKLKSFDGHKIKCNGQRIMPKMDKEAHLIAAGGLMHQGIAWAWPNVHFRGVYGRSMTPAIVAGVAFLTILSLIASAGLCCLIVRKKHRTHVDDQRISDVENPVSQMEEGTVAAESDTTARALMEGLKKQRRVSRGFPENAIVDSEDEDVVEKEDYLREKMKKQRRLSQGYAEGMGSSDEETVIAVETYENDAWEQRNYLQEKMKKQRRLSQGFAAGSASSDEESVMVEINLNENLYSSGI